jgi:hypothetical protein
MVLDAFLGAAMLLPCNYSACTFLSNLFSTLTLPDLVLMVLKSNLDQSGQYKNFGADKMKNQLDYITMFHGDQKQNNSVIS